MNYGKDATEKRLQAANSRSDKYRSRIFLTFIKTCCVLCLFCVLVISSIGIGIIMGIIDNAPELNVDSIVPIGYATTVYDSTGNLTDTLVTAGSNREEATFDELPRDLINAFVAIEDSRFWTHNGIDLRSISRAAVGVLTGENRGGGSTITQQLIKNNMFNGGMETSFGAKLERKLQEQYLALQLTKSMDRKLILTNYLNTINLGNNALGVKVAARRYFNKDVSDLTLSECAVIAGITQNPSRLNPISGQEANAEKRKVILQYMFEQGYISKDQQEEALADDVYDRIQMVDNVSKENSTPYSYFTDEVIKDVIGDLKEQKGYSELVAENMVYSGGLKIYATIDTKVQDALDSVYTDDSAFPNTEKYGEVPESAMVITDKQGDIVAIAGGRGQKTLSRSFSFATDARRQPGSSFKPLASYGPAMDAGIIVPSTTIYDRAFSEGEDGMPWPMNDGKYPTGRSLTIKEGVTRSLNTVSVQVLNALTPQASYDFLTNQLDIKLVGSRTNEDGTVQSDIALAPLALGALTDGVTVREMAGGYSTFINDGVFGGTRTYTKVLDNEGNTVLENTPYTDKGFTNVHTVYDMLDCLQNVTAHGTAYGIQIDGVETAGKTGTTSSNTDIWFCGVTPEYSAAVWVGYEHNYRLDGLYGRNAAEIWLKVMEKVHADDSGLVFDSHPQDFVEETYCMDTGLLASGACREAGRAATGRFWKDKGPTQTCSHENIEEKYDFETSGMDDYYDEYDDEESDDSSNTDSSTDSTDNGDSSYENGDSGDGGDSSGGDDGSSSGGDDDGGNIAPTPDPEPAPDPSEGDPES